MLKSHSRKTVTAGLMLALGILIPFMASHGLGLFPGNVFLPMHIPVLLCGFFCGPVYGALCGFVLPLLNSTLTGMPAIYPNAVIMSCELLTYGLATGLLYRLCGYSKKLRFIYPVLIGSLVAGRVIYGLTAAALLFLDADAGKLSVIAAAILGIPGIIIQLILVPQIVLAVHKSINGRKTATTDAIDMVNAGSATFVIVKNGKIVSSDSPRGIAYTIKAFEDGKLSGTFVADRIIGKAAAMIFSLAGVKACYGRTVSQSALKWLNDHNIKVTYGECTEHIINRTGDGICPMESTVKDTDNAQKALELLKAKVTELSGR